MKSFCETYLNEFPTSVHEPLIIFLYIATMTTSFFKFTLVSARGLIKRELQQNSLVSKQRIVFKIGLRESGSADA